MNEEESLNYNQMRVNRAAGSGSWGVEELRLVNANANGIIGQMADEIERLTRALSGLIQECEYSASSGLPFNALGVEWTQLAKSKSLLSGKEALKPESPTPRPAQTQ